MGSFCTSQLGDASPSSSLLFLLQDAQWNDINYMNGSRDFTVDSERFASLPQMVEDLHKHGQSYVLILVRTFLLFLLWWRVCL